MKVYRRYERKIFFELDIVGEFDCRGFDTFGLLKVIGGISKGKPNEKDIEKAENFAINLKKMI